MCIGVPMQVVTIDGFTAQCVARDGVHAIDMTLAAEARPGDWVMVFLGAAREVISAEAAGATLDALEALELAMRGETGFDHLFADLVGREPELPEHLKPKRRNA
ncbi:MAG: HypC/HybG/HupF family hydrogenase formation chaperone [Pseudomonadota bacterium]